MQAMPGLKTQLFRTGLSALWFSGVARVLSRVTAGKGAILMLHRVQPATNAAFDPNAALSITPEYLEALVQSFRAAHIDIVSLDEAQRRITTSGHTRRFVCFTFDDGYRDNLEHALPVFQRYSAPFTVYVTTSFTLRSFAPWWDVLAAAIAKSERVRWVDSAGERNLDVTTTDAKYRAYDELAAEFFRLPVEQMRAQVARLSAEHELPIAEFAARETCNVSELRALQAGGAEIGCHTVSHPVLRRETPETVRNEMARARETLEAALGSTVRHLAYPYGKPDHVGAREFAIARELGFATATTTRKGALFSAHAQHLQALPRVEVTPSFSSSPRYVQTIVSGLPLWAWNRGRLAVVS
ncbi:MAG: hypothetical protein RL701_6947 [Pseudomonadota bacterium]|jgi:peptidoglycan/xylan/chitin deacetylase (PgdA/CDA1 family)